MSVRYNTLYLGLSDESVLLIGIKSLNLGLKGVVPLFAPRLLKSYANLQKL